MISCHKYLVRASAIPGVVDTAITIRGRIHCTDGGYTLVGSGSGGAQTTNK